MLALAGVKERNVSVFAGARKEQQSEREREREREREGERGTCSNAPHLFSIKRPSESEERLRVRRGGGRVVEELTREPCRTQSNKFPSWGEEHV